MGLGEIGHLLSCNRTAPSARATIPSSSSSAARPSCRAPATATSSTATRTERGRARASAEGRQAFDRGHRDSEKRGLDEATKEPMTASGVATLWPHFDFARSYCCDPAGGGARQSWAAAALAQTFVPMGPSPSSSDDRFLVQSGDGPRGGGTTSGAVEASSPIRRIQHDVYRCDQWRRVGDTQWRCQLDAARRQPALAVDRQLYR